MSAGSARSRRPTAFTLDLAAVPALKERTHLPVIVDPSHAAGRRELVMPLSLAAAAAGADGLLVEVHPRPEEAVCDGPQALRTGELAAYAERVRAAAALAEDAVGLTLDRAPRTRSATSGSSASSRWSRRGGCSKSCRSRTSTSRVVLRGREQVHAILDREDDRLLVVVGPCSVHDLDATLDYARRLSSVADELKDELLIAMRVYFEKPRTTTGWKGLINDPHLDGSGDVNEGLRRARHVLLGVLERRAAGRLRVARPDHAAVHLRRGQLGRDRGAHDREPDPPPARLRAVDAGRLQEPDRRQRAGRGRRGPRRGRPARVRRDRRRRDAGDPAHARQRATATSSCGAASGSAQLRRAEAFAEALALLRQAGLPERG